MRVGSASIGFSLVLALAASAQEPDGPIPSPEKGWPQWRGPRRDGVSVERGLLQEWPEGGPKLLWKAEGLGRGWSSPIIAGTPPSIFITGEKDGELLVYALDLEGKPRWRSRNGKAWAGEYPGARASCAYRDGRVFHMNSQGRVAAFDAATGKELWAVDVLERFDGKNLMWATSECLLVDGDRVVVTPGGAKAFMAALDAKTGATAWSGDPLPEQEKQRTGYASPLLVRQGGRRMIVTLALRAMVGVDADTGKLLWSYPKRTAFDASASTPVWTASGFFYTLPLKSGAVMVRLDGALKAEKVWEHALDSCQGGVVAKDGMIYGSGNQVKQWFCIDGATGGDRMRWNGAGPGTLILADDRLYCLSETGEVVLAKVHPESYAVAGRFKLVEGRRNDVWAHPVLLDGRLYLRDHDTLFCHDVHR